MKEITSLPLCYSFSFEIETATIIFKIQKWIVTQIKSYIEFEARLMEYIYKNYGGDKNTFISFGDKGKSFGYDNLINWKEETKDEIIYSYTLVPVDEPTEEICERCDGKKIDWTGHACFDCHGTGKKHLPSKNHFSQALLSLYPIIKFANCTLHENCFDNKDKLFNPQTNKKQLIALEYSDTSGMFNCSMQAWIDNSVFEWLKKVPDDKVKNIVLAMEKTEEILLRRKVFKHTFGFSRYGDEVFGFRVPGNACDLTIISDSMGMFGQVGKTFQPHNIDHRFQQVAFLAGLATLNDLFEQNF